MENTIFIKIITPTKTEFKGEVSYIEVPTIAGVIGIYQGHIPIISALAKGEIKLRTSANELVEFSIQDGFVRFSQNKCNITIKSIVKLKKIA
jgi:F-type H+-transporting ATPase subunit epsilon